MTTFNLAPIKTEGGVYVKDAPQDLVHRARDGRIYINYRDASKFNDIEEIVDTWSCDDDRQAWVSPEPEAN